jgi:hypothetical protein
MSYILGIQQIRPNDNSHVPKTSHTYQPGGFGDGSFGQPGASGSSGSPSFPTGPSFQKERLDGRHVLDHISSTPGIIHQGSSGNGRFDGQDFQRRNPGSVDNLAKTQPGYVPAYPQNIQPGSGIIYPGGLASGSGLVTPGNAQTGTLYLYNVHHKLK